MGLFDKFKEYREQRAADKEFYQSTLDKERVTAKAQAREERRQELATKAKEKARFDALPATGRAKARVQKAKGFLARVNGKLEKAGERVQRLEKKFPSSQGTILNQQSAGNSQLGGSLGRDIYGSAPAMKKGSMRREGKTITIVVK